MMTKMKTKEKVQEVAKRGVIPTTVMLILVGILNHFGVVLSPEMIIAIEGLVVSIYKIIRLRNR